MAALPAGEALGREQRVERLRWTARTLDSLFRVPVLGIRFGLDVLVGLIPGLGDLVTAVFGSWMLVEAVRIGVPRVVLLRMLMNTGIDVIGSLVPFFGDLFDVAWKPYMRNLALIERHAATSGPPTLGDYVFVAAIIGLLVCGALIPIIVVWLLLSAINAPLI